MVSRVRTRPIFIIFAGCVSCIYIYIDIYIYVYIHIIRIDLYVYIYWYDVCPSCPSCLSIRWEALLSHFSARGTSRIAKVNLVHLGGLMAVMAVMARWMLTGLGKLSLGRTTRLDHSQLSFDSFACNWPAVGKKTCTYVEGIFAYFCQMGF